MTFVANPKAQYLAEQSIIDDAISRVLHSGDYVLGREVKRFEKEFSTFIGVEYGVGTANGADAVRIALMALGIKPGDEVITPSHTAVASVCGIVSAGATPVFCDVDEDYFTIQPNLIPSLITTKTKAILVVHIYGQSADLDFIMSIAEDYRLLVVEDCAQAHGATYNNRQLGSFGNASCFSYYPTKNLGGIGDGGMILTNDSEISEKAKLLRQYGWRENQCSEIIGSNSRLDEIQAAILRAKLPSLVTKNEARQKLARLYSENFLNLPIKIPKERPNCKHSYHLYVIQLQERDRLMNYLKEKNIFVAIHYQAPVHKQPAYMRFGSVSNLINTEKISERIVSLPIYPELSDERVKFISKTIEKFFD